MNFWPWSISSILSATFFTVAPHFHGKFTIITLIKRMKYVLCLSILPPRPGLCYKDQFLFMFKGVNTFDTFQPWFVSGHLLSVQSDFSVGGACSRLDILFGAQTEIHFLFWSRHDQHNLWLWVVRGLFVTWKLGFSGIIINHWLWAWLMITVMHPHSLK